MNSLLNQGTVNGLVKIWWEKVPAILRRFSTFLPVIFTDGIYLSAWPLVGAFAPLLCLFLGFLFGWLHIGGGETFTFSIVIMVIMLFLSNFGAAFGGWLWLGYSISDLLLFHREEYWTGFWGTVTHTYIPVFLSYVLLAMLLVFVPLISPWLRKNTIPKFGMPRLVRMGINIILQAFLQAILVYIWTQTVPTLIRPIYTWRNMSPPITAIQPLQENGQILVVFAGLIGAVRMFLEYQAFRQPNMIERVRQLRKTLVKVKPIINVSIPAFIAVPIKIGLIVILLTLLLAGLIDGWVDAILFMTVLAVLMFIRQIFRNRFWGWTKMISAIPLVFRLALVALISYLLGQFFLQAMWSGTSTFRPMLFSIATSLVIGLLLLPGPTSSAHRN